MVIGLAFNMTTTLMTAPIGVFDSGVGGLSVLAHLIKQLPHEHYIYLADTLNVPYGSKSHEQIRDLTIHAVDRLIHMGCKLVVIACNTASAYGLESLRKIYPNICLVGLVPALKPAVFASKTKQVAVLATSATLKGNLLQEIVEKFATPNAVNVYKYSLASLVPWVEAGMPEAHIAVTELENLLVNLHQNHIDQLVLGCTHFPFFKLYLMNKLKEMTMDYDLTMIDSGLAVAKRVESLLETQSLKNPLKAYPFVKFLATSNQPETTKIALRLLSQFDKNVTLKFYNV